MSYRPLLLEIGLEEMPARFIDDSIAQFKTKVEQFLDDHRISYGTLLAYATPRRLAVLIHDVAETQEDQVEESKGPAKKIALDEKGGWSKSAAGFARGQGVSTDQLYFKELKGVEYVYVTKEIKGQETAALLPQLRDVITSLTFPKNMRWGSYDLKYIRPIRWLVALYGQDVIPFEITDVSSGRETDGHRFLGQKVTIDRVEDYPALLQGQFVIANAEERKRAIRTQLSQLQEEKGWIIPVDQTLLDEVTHLVEYPTVIYGRYDEEFLSIPSEVLITTMKEHQRYFPIQDQEGKLLPYFVTVRNGEVDPKRTVCKGNEKVLRARLSDARFFYEEDKKLAISAALSQLENVIFHEELGTVGDKVRRVRDLSSALANQLNLDSAMQKQLDRAAEISKFDLVSQMVYEFPELQGRMGEEYARLAGEEEAVCQAIVEHYQPRFAGDDLPKSTAGSILSVSDKLDTIAGFFSIGIIPTGSQDPYALRRQATGIVQIMLQEEWPLTVEELFDVAINTYQNRQLMKRDAHEVKDELETFFSLRIRNRLQESGIRYDVIDALGNQHGVEPHAILAKANVLMNRVEKEAFKVTVEAFTRVNNLAIKLDRTGRSVDEERFETNEEHALYQTYQQVKEQFEQKIAEKDWDGAFDLLGRLQEPIEKFFDDVMVMVESDDVRYNRLALLNQVNELIRRYADFTQLVFLS